MAVSDSVMKAEVDALLRQMRCSSVPALSEARAAWQLEEQMNNFVFAAEGALCDAGLLVLPEDAVLPKDPTERLFHVLKTFQNQKLLLPIEFKTISPQSGAWWMGPVCWHAISLSPEQRACELVVILSPMAPHLAAVVPRHLIDRGCVEKVSFQRAWREIPVYGQKVEPFPMELSPFVIPYHYLSQAMRQYIAFYNNLQDIWKNPYSGIAISNLPRPELQPVELLRPTPTSQLKDLDDEMLLWAALRRHSKRFEFERLTIRPSVGDFLIRDTLDETRIVVETKHQMCRISLSGMVSHKTSLGDTPSFFNFFARWDYLLSISPDGWAFFVNRDDLPDESFTYTTKELRWQCSPEFIRLHKLPWNPNDCLPFVRGMEQVLIKRAQAGKSLRALKHIPFIIPSAHRISMLLGSENEQKALDMPLKDRILRGAGRRWSQRQYETMQERILKQQCVDCDFGAVYRLGYHPTSTHIFVPGKWKDNNPPSFHDLKLDTTCIPLNFAPIDYVDLAEPNDRRRHGLFFHATHGHKPSLYVLIPYLGCLAGSNLNCFVVSSEQLAGDQERCQLNSDIMKYGWHHVARRFLPIRLTRGEHLENHSCRQAQVVPHLIKMCRAWLKGGNMNTDPPHGAMDHHLIDLQRIATTKLDIMEQYIMMQFGQSLWAHRLRFAASGVESADMTDNSTA